MKMKTALSASILLVVGAMFQTGAPRTLSAAPQDYLPDLRITSVTFNGDKGLVEVTNRCKGAAAKSALGLTVYKGSSKDSGGLAGTGYDVPALAPGAKFVASIDLSKYGGVSKYYTLAIDTGFWVKEAVETNNWWNKDGQPPPDLAGSCEPSSKDSTAPPVILFPDPNHMFEPSQAVVIQVVPNPAAQSAHVRIEITQPSGKKVTKTMNPAVAMSLPTHGLTLTAQDIPDSGTYKVRAQWDYEGATWSTLRSFMRAGFFPPPAQKDAKAASQYLMTHGCGAGPGGDGFFICKDPAGLNACQMYMQSGQAKGCAAK